MCEKCRAGTIRATIALASAAYVVVESRKVGDALSGLASAIKQGYKEVDFASSDRAEDASDEVTKKCEVACSKLDGAEMSEALHAIECIIAAAMSIKSAVRHQLFNRYQAGDRSMSKGHIASIEDFIERSKLAHAIESGEMVLLEIPFPPGTEPEKPHSPGFGKMSPHVQ